MATMEERSDRIDVLTQLRSAVSIPRSWSRKKALFAPRLWVALVLLAVPCLVLVAPLFERLESTGPAGAFLADMLFSLAIISYVLLIVVLQKRSAA